MLLLLNFSLTVQASELILHAPKQSEDGSYILRLETRGNQRFDSLELYRCINGGDYDLLITVPVFKSISQMVSQNGTYGYKIRGITSDGYSIVSEPVFVVVKSKGIGLQTASQGNSSEQPIKFSLSAR